MKEIDCIFHGFTSVLCSLRFVIYKLFSVFSSKIPIGFSIMSVNSMKMRSIASRKRNFRDVDDQQSWYGYLHWKFSHVSHWRSHQGSGNTCVYDIRLKWNKHLKIQSDHDFDFRGNTTHVSIVTLKKQRMELTDIVAKIHCIRDLEILGRVRDLTARFWLKYLANLYARWSYSLLPE